MAGEARAQAFCFIRGYISPLVGVSCGCESRCLRVQESQGEKNLLAPPVFL